MCAREATLHSGLRRGVVLTGAGDQNLSGTVGNGFEFSECALLNTWLWFIRFKKNRDHYGRMPIQQNNNNSKFPDLLVVFRQNSDAALFNITF